MKISIERLKQIVKEEVGNMSEENLSLDEIQDPAKFRQLVGEVVDLSQLSSDLEFHVLKRFVGVLKEEITNNSDVLEMLELELEK